MEVMHRRSWRWTCEHTPTPAFTSKTPSATGAAAGWRFQCDTACGRAPAGLSGSANLPGKSGVIGSRSAFALIEAVMGSGLLGVLSITLYLAIAQGFAVLQVTRENLRATQILQEKMETIRLYSWDQLNQPGFVPATFTNYFDPSGSPGHQGAVYRGTTIVTNAPVSDTYAADLKLVSVQMTWTSSNSTRRRSMQTFVSRYGLQNYVYPLK